MQQDARSEANQPAVPVQVWDVPVRLFHWLVVGLVIGSWVTSEVGGNAMTYHMWIGYSILVLVLFRIFWGFVGSRHARFKDFVRGPGALVRYLRGTPAETSIGHNPLGGLSVLALLASLAVQAVTGLFTNDEIATEGPLAARVGMEWSDLLSTVHRYNFYVLLALIALHVAAVVFYLLVKRENLIKPMLTGKKELPASLAGEQRVVGLGCAALVLACAGGIVALIVKLG